MDYMSWPDLFMFHFGISMPQNEDGQFVPWFFSYKLCVNDKDQQINEIPDSLQAYFDKYWANQEPEKKENVALSKVAVIVSNGALILWIQSI